MSALDEVNAVPGLVELPQFKGPGDIIYGEEGKDWKLDENGRLVTLSETACVEAYKKLDPILYGCVDFDTEYPKAIAELEAAGINEYVAEVNRQLQEFMAKQ